MLDISYEFRVNEYSLNTGRITCAKKITWESTRAVNLYHSRLGCGEYLPCIILAGYPRRLQQLGLAKEGPILGGEHTTGLEELGEVFYRVAEMTLIKGEEDLTGGLE